MSAKDPLAWTITKRVALLAVVGAVAWFGYGWYRGHAMSANFSAEALTKLEDRLLVGEPIPPGNDLPPRTGKVVVVVSSLWRNPGNASYKPFRSSVGPAIRDTMERIEPPHLFEGTFDLPIELRASSVEDAATVVFCEPRGVVDGYYAAKDGSGARTAAVYREATLRAFDLRSGRSLGACQIDGGRLKQVISSESQSMTPAPDVVAAVAKMPLVDPAKLPPPAAKDEKDAKE